MKKSLLWLVIVIIVFVGIFILSKDNKPSSLVENNTGEKVVPVIETEKLSSTLSRFENSELGFAVNYPSAWEMNNADVGVNFIVPIDKKQVSTVAKLQSAITVIPGKCSFPPVTTIKDRDVMKTDKFSFNMITMTNSVQGREYFDRMFSLQQNNICYIFHFSSIVSSPESKGLTGSNITQAKNNNKAIISTVDTEFINMIKSFALVQGPVGQDEAKATPKK